MKIVVSKRLPIFCNNDFIQKMTSCKHTNSATYPSYIFENLPPPHQTHPNNNPKAKIEANNHREFLT